MKMRSMAILLGLFLAGGTALHAQSREIGFKLGAAFSTISSDDAELGDFDTRTGFTGGGFLRFGITPMFSIQPELMYVPKGGSTTFTEPGFGTFNIDLDLDYVEIPLLLRGDFGGAGMPAFYLYGGPAFAFEVKCEVTVSATGFGSETGDCDDEDIDVERETTDIGLMIGGGVGFLAGPGRVFIEGRYNFGMRDLDPGEDGELKNRSGAVLAGFSVSLR